MRTSILSRRLEDSVQRQGSRRRQSPGKWRLLIPCLALIGWSHAAAQDLKIPDRLWVCEGTDSLTCGTWTFRGKEGAGKWRNGAAADLFVQQFDPAWIIIRRTDTSGTSPGLIAIYTGRLTGNRIEGTVKWTWQGHWSQQVEGTWYATLEEPGSIPPEPGAEAGAPQIRQEAPPQAPPASTGGGMAFPERSAEPPGDAQPLPNAQPEVSISVQLAYPWTDTGLYLAQGQSVTVSARGTMNWYTGSCNGHCLSSPTGIPCPGGGAKRLGLTCLSLIGKVGQAGRPFEVGESLTFTAPAAGEFLLGVNDEYLVDNTGEWTATIRSPTPFAPAPWRTQEGQRGLKPEGDCNWDYGAGLSAEEAVTRGQQAFEQRQLKKAGCWWQIAAEKGHPDGQFYLGIWYEYGQGGIKDHDEGLRWLNNAAAGGHIQARQFRLSRLYSRQVSAPTW